MAKVVMTRGVDLEPIDRLEDKLKMLVNLIDRLRADTARASQENERLARELDGMRARIAEAEGADAELSALREERDLIRSRVAEMLQQIERLNSVGMDDSRIIHVEIHGQQYPIRSGLDPVYVAELAAYVDTKMRLASRETTAGDTLKIAVLAALNIADECFRAQHDEQERT